MLFYESVECFRYVILVACLTGLFVVPFVALLFRSLEANRLLPRRRPGKGRVVVFIAFSVAMMVNSYPTNADKSTNRTDVCGGGLELSGEVQGLRDLEPVAGPTNFAFTAYSATPSSEVFAVGWPEGAIPYGSRIELHEKLSSLTNAWNPVRQYVVGLGQTNLCDTLSLTNGHPSASFKKLYGDALTIVFPNLPTVVSAATGRRLSVAIDSEEAIPVSVDRSERPEEFPPYDPAFAADPFAHVEGLSYDQTNATVEAVGPGAFTLATGDALVVLAPSLSFGTPHDYAGETLASHGGGRRSGSGSYSVESAYPLDEPCLWEGWHVGTNTSFGCTCIPELTLGMDVSAFAEISNTVEVAGDTAVAKVFLGGSLVWSNSCEHARHWSSGGRSDLLSNDGCSSCGSCSSGSCDAFDGPSVGSVRFRISLGSPADGKVSGFLWFDRDAVFQPSPSSFSLLARSDAHVVDSTANGIRTVVCSDQGGRTIAVSSIAGGVRIDATFTATGEADRSWEITREDGAMRFRKFNARGYLMSDVSYSPSGDAWAVADNVSGRTDLAVSTGKTLDEDNGWSRTVETVSVCGVVTGRHVRVVSEVVGSGEDAVLRETERSEKCAGGAWRTSRASYWNDGGTRRNGQIRMSWGDDRAWSWTDYDELGREVFRLDQRDGSAAPEDDFGYSMEVLPDGDAFATVTDYSPHVGDSCHASDWDRPRTVSRYVIHDHVSNLVARTWTRYVRGVAANGWPTVAETTIRACSQTACIDNPSNAVSTVVRYDDETSLVPYLLRGETISETDEDGVTETHSHTILSNSVVRTVVSRTKGGHEAKTREVKERDLDYGLTLYEATQLTADPSVEFGWRRHAYDSRNRLVFTQYDDGSSETNEYSCCRLLSHTDRTGAKTLYSAKTGTENLYHAEEEVYLKGLLYSADYMYPVMPTNWGRSSVYVTRYRATQHFFDAFGRATNVVVRGCQNDGSMTNSAVAFSFGPVRGRRTSYPEGTGDRERVIDENGLVTDTVSYDSATGTVAVAEERDGELAPSVSRRTIRSSLRGGGSVQRVESGGKWRETRDFSVYGADGCRTDFSVVCASDAETTTNGVRRMDFLGRVASSSGPVSDVTNLYVGAAGRVLAYLDLRSGTSVTNLYDETGEMRGIVSRGIVQTEDVDYRLLSNAWWRVETSAVAGTETNSLCEAWTRLTGLSDALRAESRTFVDGVLTSDSSSYFDPESLRLYTTEASTVRGATVTESKFGRVLSVTAPEGMTENHYDPFGNVFYVKRTDGGGTLRARSLMGYDACDRVVFDGRFVAQRSAVGSGYSYDVRGNCVSVTNEVDSVIVRAYDAEGRVVSESGDTYPLLFGYDSSGRRTSLSTTRDGVNFDVTSWGYDAATGLCTNKVYADGTSETYSYAADGKPVRTTRPDGRWTENVYDANRRCVGQASSDASCAYGLALDAFGRTIVASNDVARYVYALVNCGVATNETATVGPLSLEVARTVDPYGRVTSAARDGIEDAVFYNPTNVTVAAVSNSEACVTYAYTRDLLDAGYTLTLANGASFSRELRRRSTYWREEVSSVTNSSPAATNGWRYGYDNLKRPVSRNADAFAYNARGEVSGAFVGGASVAYAYDGIGNLSTSAWNAVATTYSASALNQYESIASGGATLWPEYSANGELTRLGGRSFFYDAKSRLVSAGDWVFDEEMYAGGGHSSQDCYRFVPVVSNVYDHLDRRVQKVTPAATHTFFYDGWMLIKELVANTNGTTDVIEYHWGKDLSGSIGGAGGVGGLLYLTISNSSTPNSSTRQLYVPFYDAYGNVMGYWDAQGNVVAEYTYDAFGKLISSSGPMAEVFSFRYSTKYYDPETGLYYYGYRFYSPELMRWLTRDPIEEEGGVNLYCLCRNNTVSNVDPVGYAVFLVLAGLDNSQNTFLNLKVQMADAARVALKSLTLLNSFTEKHYECLKRKNAVFFNGKNYYGTLEEYKNLIRHELKSCIKIRGDFRGSVLAVKSLAVQMDKPWDYLVYFAHGGDGRECHVRTILSFSDGLYDQHAVLEYVSNYMMSRNGTKLVISCFQTWDGQGDKPLHPETIRLVPPRLKYYPSGGRAVLDYTTHKVIKGVK